ncbi:hypothetical protein ACUZ9N_01120 [Mycoplasmopsis gallinarum]
MKKRTLIGAFALASALVAAGTIGGYLGWKANHNVENKTNEIQTLDQQIARVNNYYVNNRESLNLTESTKVLIDNALEQFKTDWVFRFSDQNNQLFKTEKSFNDTFYSLIKDEIKNWEGKLSTKQIGLIVALYALEIDGIREVNLKAEIVNNSNLNLANLINLLSETTTKEERKPIFDNLNNLIGAQLNAQEKLIAKFLETDSIFNRLLSLVNEVPTEAMKNDVQYYLDEIYNQLINTEFDINNLILLNNSAERLIKNYEQNKESYTNLNLEIRANLRDLYFSFSENNNFDETTVTLLKEFIHHAERQYEWMKNPNEMKNFLDNLSLYKQELFNLEPDLATLQTSLRNFITVLHSQVNKLTKTFANVLIANKYESEMRVEQNNKSLFINKRAKLISDLMLAVNIDKNYTYLNQSLNEQYSGIIHSYKQYSNFMNDLEQANNLEPFALYEINLKVEKLNQEIAQTINAKATLFTLLEEVQTATNLALSKDSFVNANLNYLFEKITKDLMNLNLNNEQILLNAYQYNSELKVLLKLVINSLNSAIKSNLNIYAEESLMDTQKAILQIVNESSSYLSAFNTYSVNDYLNFIKKYSNF